MTSVLIAAGNKADRWTMIVKYEIIKGNAIWRFALVLLVYVAINEQVNLEIMKRFEAEQIEFAFPTQTLYIKKD